MRCRKQLVLKALEVKNEEEYRLMLASDEDALYPPWFYTWVEKSQLAAFAWPQTRGNLEFLWEEGIRHVVTLCPEKVPPFANSKFEWTFIPVTECQAPSIEDIFKFIRVVQYCRKNNQDTNMAYFDVEGEVLIENEERAQVRLKQTTIRDMSDPFELPDRLFKSIF